MRIKIDNKSYLDLKKDKNKNVGKLSIKTKDGNKSFIITAELNEDNLAKLIAELISIKAEIYGQE